MGHIAGENQASEFLNQRASKVLSRTLDQETLATASCSPPTLAFVGYRVWRPGEINPDLSDEHVFVVCDGQVKLLPWRLDLQNTSLDGLSWGYVGSASSQLALAMLMMVLEDWPRVQRIYHKFQTDFVARLPMAANWMADGTDVLAWALELEKGLPPLP